jgi:hypothetical protein
MDFLRPEDFGLTSPPRAEELVPNSLTGSPVAPLGETPTPHWLTKSRNPTLRERFANISNIYCSIDISIMLFVTVGTIYEPYTQ